MSASEPAIGEADTSAGIRLEGLSKSFGPVRAVRGIDLEIAHGETVALLGPNGAGKSTTIDMLLGLSTPDAGTVSVFGRSPAEAGRAGVISGMLQVGELIRQLTVREIVTMMASLYPSPRPVDEVLELTGLTELAERRTQKLSGGQTQRVRFAIALVAGADLLVLDEPTVALDVEARREFWKAIRGVAAEGRTIVFATHYLEEADEFADRIVLMARGRIVADGPSTEIKAHVGLRTIRATLAGVESARLAELPGVSGVERHGDAITLKCSDADAALHRLLREHPDTRDIEVRGAGLEEAFLELTGDEHATDDEQEPLLSERGGGR